ncbi:MAG TPA: BatD family protein [Brumimicrobium sp.]|nr:BatD family protein [Brumimicrobium sp.]
MVRKLFLHIVFFVLSLHVFGQDEFVDLEIKPKNVEVGQSITITIKTNVNGDLDMSLPDEFIQSGAMQSGMSSSIEYVDGRQRIMRYSFQTFTGYFEDAGSYSLGPVKVSAKTKEYKSKDYTVKVTSRQNMISDNPAKNLNQIVFGIIEQSKKEIYEGEPLVFEGKVYSQVEILQVEDFHSFTFDGPSDSRSLVASSQVSTAYEVINGKNLQTFKIGKTLVFPEKPGEYKIKPFETTIVYNDRRKIFPERLKVVSNEANIVVKPLPSGVPKYFIDAVGNFTLTANIENPHIDQGKVVELKLKISGKGNLHNIQKPKVRLPHGLTFYGDPEIVDSITYSAKGAEGSKTFTYFIQVNRGGSIQLSPIKIAYFNPKTEKYETSVCKVKTLHVKSSGEDEPEEIEEEIQEIKEPTMQPYITERIVGGQSPTTIFTGWKGALLLCSPIMFGFVLGLLVRVKKQSKESILAKQTLVQHKTDALYQLSLLNDDENNETRIDALSQIIVRFLANQFKVSNGEITRVFLREKAKSEVPEEIIVSIIQVFDELDATKFGGSIDNSDVSHLIDEVAHIINSFE